jgi:hypothetical protein
MKLNKLFLGLGIIISSGTMALAGQQTGGGPGSVAIIDPTVTIELPDILIRPLPNFPIKGVELNDFRRTAARLSVGTQSTSTLKVDGRLKEVKNLEGGIVDLGESTQFLPDTLIEILP